MLRLKFDPKLDFQIDSINSVVNLFKGQTKKPFAYTFQIIPNLDNVKCSSGFQKKKD